MNTAFLLMSTALIAGSDPAGCAGCVGPVPVAAACDSCGPSASPGLFSRLRGKLGCGAACGTPVYSAPACGDCGGSSSPGLLTRLKARLQHSKGDCGSPCAAPPCDAAPCASGDCGAAGGYASPAAPGVVMPAPAPAPLPMTESPKAMPKAETPKVEPRKLGVDAPSVSVPAAPI